MRSLRLTARAYPWVLSIFGGHGVPSLLWLRAARRPVLPASGSAAVPVLTRLGARAERDRSLRADHRRLPRVDVVVPTWRSTDTSRNTAPSTNSPLTPSRTTVLLGLPWSQLVALAIDALRSAEPLYASTLAEERAATAERAITDRVRRVLGPREDECLAYIHELPRDPGRSHGDPHRHHGVGSWLAVHISLRPLRRNLLRRLGRARRNVAAGDDPPRGHACARLVRHPARVGARTARSSGRDRRS